MQRDDWDEQRELHELNSRLLLYVSRVRDLEQENRLLAQELAALRGQEQRACRLEQHEDEVAELRLVVAELSRAKGEAEQERDALGQERARLEAVGAQVLELRRHRLEPELLLEREQLERLQADCAALEALLQSLRAEHGRLREEQRRRRRRRPAQSPALPPPPTGAGPWRAVGGSGRELEDTCALVLSWSCEQSLFERYEAALQELEGRLGRENVAGQRARNQQDRRQLDELHRRYEELAGLAERLEQERLAQRERHGSELAEYQMIIETLEEEKQFLTMSIAEYLKDYHELLQVKAGLSLEIETYRALLEGESSQWILMWDEKHGRKLPQGVRNKLYEYSNHSSTYQQEKGKRTFPAIGNIDTRYKMPVTNISSSAVYSSVTKPAKRQTAGPGKVMKKDTLRSAYFPSAGIKKEKTTMDQREMRTFTPPYFISRDNKIQQRTLPERKKTETVTTESFSEVQRGMTSPTVKVGILPTFPSYGQSSTFKESEYERAQEAARTKVNEQIKKSKLMKEEKSVLVDSREKREGLIEIAIDAAPKKMDQTSATIERNIHVEEKAKIKQGTDERKHVVEDKTPKYGKYAIREERIRVDTLGKDFPSNIKMEGSTATQKEDPAQTPADSDVHVPDHILKNDNIKITLQDLKSSVSKQKDEAVYKRSGNIPERESNQHGDGEEESLKMDLLLTESIAENIVSDILKGFVQKKSSDLGPTPNTKVTFFEKKEVSEDGKVKTEVNVHSTVQEELDIPDDFDLGSFLKKDVKVLEERKGTPTEDAIKDIINAGLKGKEGKGKRTVHVEIVEEPLEFTADERTEFSTPFKVEEAEDSWPSVAGHPCYPDGERATVRAADDFKKKQPSMIVSQVEEISEGDDLINEEKYFVSTPDEHPLTQEKDEGCVYGQIHIEEESTIKYSWQDEFLQGSQAKINEGKGSPEPVYQVTGGEEGTFLSKEESPKEQVAHAESIVIEREIKIPHEFQASIKGLFSQESKDPKHQLKEALEKLEDSLPESVKQELSALTEEGQGDSSSLEVDIKKVENTKKGGLVTIVAEVNLSQTLDSDQLSTGYLGEGVVEGIKSSANDEFDEYKKQKSEICSNSRNKDEIDLSSTPWTTEEISSTAKLSSSDGVEYHINDQVIHESPFFKGTAVVRRGDLSHLEGLADINSTVQQIIVSPTEIDRTEQILHEHPISEMLGFGRGEAEMGASTDIGQSMKEFELGHEGIETMQEIIYRGPDHKTMQVSGPEDTSQAEFSVNARTTKYVALESKQIIEDSVIEGQASDLSSSDEGLSQTHGTTETRRSIKHIRLDPKDVYTEQVIYEGPLPGFVDPHSAREDILTKESVTHFRLGQKQRSDQTGDEEASPKTTESSYAPDKLLTEGMLDINTTVRHIKLTPKELVTAEQTIFKGPISKQHLEISESGQSFPSEGLVRHITLGQKEVQSVVYQDSVSEFSSTSSADEELLEVEGPSERSTRHIKLSPSETHTEQIVFQGPVSKALKFSVPELSSIDRPPESSKSVGHIKIGPKETSFTFQMDVTNMAGRGQEATILLPNRKGAEVSGAASDGQKEEENEQGAEKSAFDQTVQLQRMVDQRSVISDEKKIALLYLNKNEEEEEEEDGPWF